MRLLLAVSFLSFTFFFLGGVVVCWLVYVPLPRPLRLTLHDQIRLLHLRGIPLLRS